MINNEQIRSKRLEEYIKMTHLKRIQVGMTWFKRNRSKIKFKTLVNGRSSKFRRKSLKEAKKAPP